MYTRSELTERSRSRRDVIWHTYPRRKVKLLALAAKQFVNSPQPRLDPSIDQRLHFLHVTERIWACCDLTKMRVVLVVLHVEQRLGLPKASRDVMVRFASLSVVDFGKLRGI